MKKRLSILLGLFFVLAIMLIGGFGITAFASENEGVYTITYHLDSGTNAVKNPDVYTAEDIIELKDATKEGYTFEGWYLDAGKTNQITEISGKTGNIELYAKFFPNSYTATFKDNIILTVKVPGFADKTYSLPYETSIDPYSESFMSDYIARENNSVSPSKDPKFSGWYVLNNDGTQKKISSSLNIYADTTIVCNFNKSVGTVSSSEKLSFGTQSFASSVGYRGKFVVPTLSNGKFTLTIYLPSYMGTGGYNYIEAYVRNWTTGVTYYNAGRLTSLYETITINASPGDVITIDVTGSTHNGYISLSRPQRMSASLTSKKSSNVTVHYDNMVNAPQPRSQNGYTFIGWQDENGNILDESKWTYLESMSFVPKFQPKEYNISYELDGGENNISNPSKYTIEDVIELQAPSKKGYTFNGWYLDKDFQNPISSISNRTGALTLYAKYSINTYGLSLDGDGGSFSPKVIFVSDEKIIRTEYLGENDSIDTYRPAKKDGYIFGGWYQDAAFTSVFKFTGKITDDITLYAKWIACENEIQYPEITESFNVNISGKTEQLYAFIPLNDETIKVTSNSDDLDLYGILYNSSKSILISADDIGDSDLDFSYTYNVEAGQLYYISVKGNTASTRGSAIVNIEWTGDTAISGTTYSSREVEITYDSSFSLPDLPIKDGYIFMGWYDETDTQITDGKWEFASDKTLTAKWREKTPHTITFKDANGEIIAVQDYLYGDTITPPEFPIKESDQTYTYIAEWDNDYNGICTGDAIYTVVYTPMYIDYTIIFKDDNGNVLSNNKYHYGDMIVAPDAPIKEADNTYTYSFKSWDNEITNCVGDATYTATYDFTYIDYTVTFKNFDGSVISAKTYHYGDSVTVPSAPTKAADATYTYVFAGWNNNVTVCEGNTEYVATFTPKYIEYTVVFMNYDDKVISTKTYHYGQSVTAPTNPFKPSDVRYSYTFAGWDTPVTACAGDTMYKATYSSEYIDYTITFVDYNGTVLATKTYHYGETIEAIDNPIRAADNTYTYTFAGWDKELGKCAGNETYTATYTSAYANYTVIFKNYNGDVISTKTYHYGDAVATPSNPKKPSDENYCYVFAGWDKSVTNCYGNAEYTAKFTAQDLPIVAVNSSSARANENVVVNILLSGAPNLESLAISDILYDTSAFELVSVEWKVSDAILSNWDAATGKGALALSTSKDLNGTIISLIFKVKVETADGNYPVSCTVTSHECDFKNVAGQITVYSVAPGDVDGNESVDKNDAIYLLMHSFFPEDYPINQEADYNGNGTVDKDDAIHLLMYTFFPDDYPLVPASAAVTLTTEDRKKEDEE